jgi:HPt (histidine-containing phosphotransfer) domain-containing protein
MSTLLFIHTTLQAPLNDQSFLLIMRASHVIKGASSNLMCQQLRECSTNLEQAAAVANDISSEDKEALEAEATKVREKHVELTKAVDSYHEMLKAVEI